MEIVEEEQLPNVSRQRGFHTHISFLDSIGMLTKGFSLKDLFAEVNAKNSIPHILSGKVIARSLRAHQSVQSALMTLSIQIAIEDATMLPDL